MQIVNRPRKEGPSKSVMLLYKPRKNVMQLTQVLNAQNKVHIKARGQSPGVVCQKTSFLKVSVSLGGFGPSVAHGKHSVRRRRVQATKNKAETCSLLDAIGRRSCSR